MRYGLLLSKQVQASRPLGPTAIRHGALVQKFVLMGTLLNQGARFLFSVAGLSPIFAVKCGERRGQDTEQLSRPSRLPASTHRLPDLPAVWNRFRVSLSRLMVASLFASLGACATPAEQCSPGMGPPVLVFTLFFGQSVPGRGDVTDNEWQSFLDDTITVNLPNGYTVIDANGAWMNPVTHRTIKEPTKILLVALPFVTGSLAIVNRIRTEYQVRFHQQLVGMTTGPACGAF